MSSSDASSTIHRVLPSSLDAYQDLMKEVLAQLEALHWEKQELFGVQMALEESLSNAIRHGNKQDSGKQVHFECQLSEARFWAKICDEGEGYQPWCVPDCCSNENLEAAGGRGLALIRHYMTKVEHRDQGRCLVIEKKRGITPPSD